MNSAYYINLNKGSSCIVVYLMGPGPTCIKTIRVHPPNRLERMFGLTWESKVINAVGRLSNIIVKVSEEDKLRVSQKLLEEAEADRICKKLSTDVGE